MKKSAVTEAPASWNTKYVTPDGFICQLTLWGDNGNALLEKANAALTWLKDNGYMPCMNNGSALATMEVLPLKHSRVTCLLPMGVVMAITISAPFQDHLNGYLHYKPVITVANETCPEITKI